MDSYYAGVQEVKELYSVEDLNQYLKAGWVLRHGPITKLASTELEKGVMVNTTIVYVVYNVSAPGIPPTTPASQSTPAQPASKQSETKPPTKFKPKTPPTPEAVRSVLQPQYEADEVTFEEDNKVVKVPYSDDKDKWKAANDKMKTLGFKYHKGPARWMYEG